MTNIFTKEYNNIGEHVGYTFNNGKYQVLKDFDLPDDAEIDEGTPPLEADILEIEKDKAIDEANKATQAIIYAGYLIEPENALISMSDRAQTNLLGLAVKGATIDFTDGYPISTKDDGEFLINSLAKLNSIIEGAFQFKVAALAAGRKQKADIKACENLEELEIIKNGP